MKTVTATGQGKRVQIIVIDLTGEDTPPSIRSERPTFAVYSLPGHYHLSTSYRSKASRQEYCGDDPDAAWDAAAGVVGSYNLRRQVPSRFQKYLTRWGK